MSGTACEEGNMDVKTLQDSPPWDWPDGAGTMFLGILRDNHAAESDCLLAAALAGDLTVINADSEVLAAEEASRTAHTGSKPQGGSMGFGTKKSAELRGRRDSVAVGFSGCGGRFGRTPNRCLEFRMEIAC